MKMSYIEDIDESNQAINIVYESLGRFVSNFELLLDELNTGICKILQKHNFGNSVSEKEIANILLSEMDAVQLSRKYFALMCIEYPDYESIFVHLRNKVIKLIECRNEAVHGKHLIHFGAIEQAGFFGYNFKTRSEFNKNLKQHQPYHFKKLFNYSVVLKSYIYYLNISLTFPETAIISRVTKDNIDKGITLTSELIYNPENFKDIKGEIF
jgi:hypothetical protein